MISIYYLIPDQDNNESLLINYPAMIFSNIIILDICQEIQKVTQFL
jgi:hypothetical protein